MGAPRGQRILVTGSAGWTSTATAATPCRAAITSCGSTRCRWRSSGSPRPAGSRTSWRSAASRSLSSAGRRREARRWSREYRQRLVREEVTSLERVQDLGSLETLMLRLPELVGSPLSLNALREDLQVSHRTVAGWMAILERLYAVFRLPPFGAPRIRAVKKEQKHYHFDWTLVPGRSAALREPRRLAPAQVGALPGGQRGPRPRAAGTSATETVARSTSSWSKRGGRRCSSSASGPTPKSIAACAT